MKVAQETWGLKVDADLKEKVREIIKNDFDSSKDFLEQLVSIYELNQLKQDENVLTAEIEELESLTRRINGVFINANAKINSMLKDKDLKTAETVELKQKLIERLQISITKVEEEKEEISKINDSLVNLNSEYSEQINQLTKSTRVLEDLVGEYKEKNDMLTGLLAEYKEDREQNKALEAQNKGLEKSLNETRTNAADNAKDLAATQIMLKEQAAKYEAALKETESKHQNVMQETLDKHIDELDSIKRKAEIDANMTILALQQEHQAKMQAQQEKYNREIEEYQAKYKQLLEKMEQKNSRNHNKQTVNNN